MNISLPSTLPLPTPAPTTGSPTQPVADAPVTATEEVAKTPAPSGNGVLPLDGASALSDTAGTRFKVNQASNIKERFMNLLKTVNDSAAKMLSGLNLDDKAQHKVDKALGKFEKAVHKELSKLMSGDKSASEVSEKLEHKLDKLTEKLGKIIDHSLGESDEAEGQNDNDHDDDQVKNDNHDRGHHGDSQENDHGHQDGDHDDHHNGVNLPPVVSYPGTPVTPKTPVAPTKASPATPISTPTTTPSVTDANGFTVQPVTSPPVAGPVTITPTAGPDITQNIPVSSTPIGNFNLHDAMSAFQSATGDALNQFIDALTQFGPSLIGQPSIASYGQPNVFALATLTPGVGVDQVA